MIESKEQAEAAIAQVVEWIKRQPTHPYPFNAKEREADPIDEIRDWCFDLLAAANANDMGGCPLCQA